MNHGQTHSTPDGCTCPIQQTTSLGAVRHPSPFCQIHRDAHPRPPEVRQPIDQWIETWLDIRLTDWQRQILDRLDEWINHTQDVAARCFIENHEGLKQELHACHAARLTGATTAHDPHNDTQPAPQSPQHPTERRNQPQPTNRDTQG